MILRGMTDRALPAKPRARSDVLFRQLDDEWVVFDPSTGRLHALNLTAALVWSQCTGEQTVAEIAQAVGDSFEAAGDRAAVLQDVTRAIRQFATEALLA